jgi:hypothetical protein
MVDTTTVMPQTTCDPVHRSGEWPATFFDLERLMRHRFATGQRVRLRPSHRALPASSGSFKIMATLPIEGTGEIRYRIKSEAENFERVVDESTLSLTV